MSVNLDFAASALSGDVELGSWRIPRDVWDAVYRRVRLAGHVADPFKEGDSCWKFALYLGIGAVESGYTFNMAIEGDEAVDRYSGAAATCCTYWIYLHDVNCSWAGYANAWEAARAHAPFGDYGAYLSHGIYQLYVCGQGNAYVCQPARLHELALHMDIACSHITNAINIYWNDANVEQSCRTCAQASGHPGWAEGGDYDYRVTNIWNATKYVQPHLCAFLEGEPGPSPGPGPEPSPVNPSPLPPIPGGGSGQYPVPPIP